MPDLGGLPRHRFSRLVGRDHHAVGCRFGADEMERSECTAVSEEMATRSQNERVDQEHVPVDEVVLHECLDELAAAHHH